MNDFGNRYRNRIRQLGIFSMIFPLAILLASVMLSEKGLSGMVKDYDQGAARVVQYVLFALGVVIFFFCDGISDFFAHRLFVQDKEREQENLSSYFAYIFIILWLLNMISTMGFVGFLISGNLTWLTVFVILTLSLQVRYFPSRRKFDRLVTMEKR